MNNVIEAINELIKGVNNAYSRGAYTMSEAHSLHEAIEFIKNAATTKNQQESEIESQIIDKKEKDDY
jgi:hypothetical protein